MNDPAPPGTPVPSSPARKAETRVLLLTRRRILEPQESRLLSSQVVDRVRRLPEWTNAREVLLYLPVKGEVDTWPLIRDLWARQVVTLLPCCRPEEHGVMDLARVTGESQIVPGRFQVPEPDLNQCPLETRFCPDLALIPGVGFDRRGCRLGHGAGYYDRFLARSEMLGCRLVGLAFHFQIVDTLPCDPWDRPVDLVVTDREVITCP